jgi:hypothetical protein
MFKLVKMDAFSRGEKILLSAILGSLTIFIATAPILLIPFRLCLAALGVALSYVLLSNYFTKKT